MRDNELAKHLQARVSHINDMIVGMENDMLVLSNKLDSLKSEGYGLNQDRIRLQEAIIVLMSKEEDSVEIYNG